MKALTHLDGNGRARMVDVGSKRSGKRKAETQAVLRLSREAFAALLGGALKKGEPFAVATIAGIQAAKRTDEWIPLCHSLPLDHISVRYEPLERESAIRIMAETSTTAKTGIELEAFVAVTAAALALYDMVKAVDPAASITDICLLRKTGGKQPFERSRPCAQPS